MSSYVNKKCRVFTQPGSVKVIQKRSESRLKSAKSATDNRSWTDCVEDRRQYILELIKSKAGGLSLGKYIPIEVIIDVLLANKNAQIAELQRQLDAYKKLKLTDDQKRQLDAELSAGDAGDGIEQTITVTQTATLYSPKTTPPKATSPTERDEKRREEFDTTQIIDAVETDKDAVKGPTADDVLPEKRGTIPDFIDEEDKKKDKRGGIRDEGLGDITGKRKGEFGPGDYKDKGETSDELLKKDLTPGSSKDDQSRRSSGDDKSRGTGQSRRSSGDDKTRRPSGGDKSRRTSGGDKTKRRSADDEARRPSGDDEGRRPSGDDEGRQPTEVDGTRRLSQDDESRPSKDDESRPTSKDEKAKRPKDDQLGEPSGDDQTRRTPKDEELREPPEGEKFKGGDELEEPGVPLRSEFQKIVEGDFDIGELDEAKAELSFPLKSKFIQISETLEDGGVEKGQLEEISKENFDNKDEVISALQKKLEEQRKSNELAERAINQLESIKDIIESSGLCVGEGVLCTATCKFACKVCPNLSKKANDIGNKKQKLEDLMRERDQLLLKVSDLEAKLAQCEDLPGKIKQFAVDVQKEISTIPPNELQNRLDQVVGLEIKVQDLVDQILDKDETCASGTTCGQGRSASDDEERDKMKLELEKARQGSQMLNAENEMLKRKLQELANCEKDRDELKKKLNSMEEDNKSKHDTIRNMEKECNYLSCQLENVKQLKKEKDMMQRQVGDLECCIADLEDEIKRLVGHIDRLTEGRDEQQSRMQNAMSDIRAELEKKTSIIEKSEEKLSTVQDKLEKSIRRVTSETTVYKNKIEDLENNLARKEEQIKNLNKNLSEKDEIIESLNRMKREIDQPVHSEDSIIRNLKQDLDNSIKQNEKLQKDLEKLIMFNNNEASTQKMLTQSKAAIKRIREEIERQYKEWESGSGEDYERVEELKGRINLLEAEVSRMKNINEELKGALQNQKKCTCLTGIENTALKKHSSEIQNIAKHQVEELLEHLKKAQMRILELEELLKEAKQQRSNADLKDVDAACDIESEDLLRLMRENEVLKQQLQDVSRAGSAGDQDLLNEIQRLKNEKASLESDKVKLEKENENLKTKSSIQLSAEQGEREQQTESLKKDNDGLKAALDNAQNEIDELKNKLKAADSGDQSDVELKQLRNENQELKKLLEDMEKFKNQLSECLNKEAEAKNALSDMEKENAELKAKLQKGGQDSSNQADFKTENDELRSKLEELGKRNRQIDEELKNSMKEKSTSAAAEDALKKENDDLKNKLQALEKSASAESSLSKEIADLKNQLQDLEKSKKELLDSLDKHKNENSDLKGKLEGLEKLKEELSKCLDNEKKSKTQFFESEEALKKQNLELQNKLQEFENLKKELAECVEKERRGESNSVNELNKKIEEMEMVRKELTYCLESEKKSKSELIMSEEALKKQNADLQNKLDEIERLKKELSDCLDNEKKGRMQADDAMRKQNDELKKQLEEMEKITKQITDVPVEVQTDLTELQAKLNELEKLKKELAECQERERKARGDADGALKNLEICNNNNEALKKEIESLSNKLAENMKEQKGDGGGGLRLEDFDGTSKLKEENEKLKKELEENADTKRLAEEVEQLKEQLARCLEEKPPGDAGEEITIDYRSVPVDLLESDERSKEELMAEIRRLMKEMEDQKAEYNKTIKMQKEQYDREVKSLKNSNRVSIEKLQNQLEDHVQELESQHDLDVQNLKKELRKSQMSAEKLAADKGAGKNKLSAQTFCVCSEMPRIVPIITTIAAEIGIPQKESPYDRPGRWPKPKGTQDHILNQILYKAIQNGMESLSMDELKMIYADLMRAMAKLRGKAIPSKMISMPGEDPMEKIEKLEDNLHRKHRAAKQKMIALHANIRSAEKKIEYMKTVLQTEKEHNAELRSRLTAMERESQIFEVERNIMKQRTTLQEHEIAKLTMNYKSSNYRIKGLEDDLRRKKVKKAPAKCSFCNENREAQERRFPSSQKPRSISSSPASVSGRTPFMAPQIDLPSPSDRKDKGRRTKKGI